MKIEKIEKLVANLHDKTEYVIPIRNLKQTLNHGLVMEKVHRVLNPGLVLEKAHRVVKFSQNAWLKPYIDMNTDLRKIAKNDAEKDFFKFMNNAGLGKTLQKVRKHRDIKLVTIETRRNPLVSEPAYHTKFFIENLLAVEMKKN